MTEQTLLEDTKDEIRQRHRETREELVPDRPGKLFIGGEWVESASGETFETRDPTTGEVLGEVQRANEVDIDRAVGAARDAFDSEWSSANPAERQSVLNRMADRFEERLDEFARLETLDNGKPTRESRIDMNLVADQLRYFAGAARMLEGQTVPVNERTHVETIREPYGVAGQIIPWNFPLFMASLKMAPALAAGNAVVLKVAEQTPLSALEFMREVGDLLPDGVLNLITGFGTEAGEPLTRHPDVDKLAFTGSTEVGKQVMTHAAENVVDVTLELGGKSPLIVFPDADPERAAKTAVLSIFYNAGQCCTAGSRHFVHEDIRDEFVEQFRQAAKGLRLGDPLRRETTLGPKVSREQVERTLDYLDLAGEEGASFLTGEEFRPNGSDGAYEDGYYVLPTILEDLSNTSRIAQEEIFGPVANLVEWNDYDDMIRQANDVKYGLASGILTRDLNRAYRTARDLEVGTVWINRYNHLPVGMPYGGYKESGIGREAAFETAKNYTQTKSINMGLG